MSLTVVEVFILIVPVPKLVRPYKLPRRRTLDELVVAAVRREITQLLGNLQCRQQLDIAHSWKILFPSLAAG